MLSGRIVRALAQQARISSTRAVSTSSALLQHAQILPDNVNEHFPALGNRDIVGFGTRGDPNYADVLEFPFPAVRFRENTPELLALRQKAKDSWKSLSLEEKKTLYRADYCRTFAELEAPTGESRSILAGVLWALAVTGWFLIFIKLYVYPPRPRTNNKEWQEATVEKFVKQRQGHIQGVASLWDYEKGQWKD